MHFVFNTFCFVTHYFLACKKYLEMDFWFLVDVSNNVSETDFQITKNFSRDFQNLFTTSAKVQFGWSIYSFRYETIFKFTDQQNKLFETILPTSRLFGKTRCESTRKYRYIL